MLNEDVIFRARALSVVTANEWNDILPTVWGEVLSDSEVDGREQVHEINSNKRLEKFLARNPVSSGQW